MRKIKWGVMGTAFIADWCTIPGMQLAENCELYAIAGRNPEKVEAFKAKYGFEKGYVGYDALLADPEVEAVYIPLTNDLHKEWTIKALNAKKHVLCEKPLAPTPEECQEMIDVAEKNGVILIEAFAYLHSPYTKAIKSEIDSGALGDILYMESAFVTSDYSMSNFRMQKGAFGGCLYDLGCYCTSQILWMLEEEPERIQAAAEFSEEGIDVFTTALFTYKGNKRAQLNCGMVLATDKDDRFDRFQIFGTKGSITSTVRFNEDGELEYTLRNGDNVQVKTVSAPHNYGLEVERLGRCITDGEHPHVSHEFTMKNARTIRRILDIIGY